MTRVSRHDEESKYFLDKKLVTKLENDLEQLQKDRDSVYNLDESFYKKLFNRYIKPDDEDSMGPKQTSVIGVNHETVDDFKRDESKEDQEESSNNYTSDIEDNKSNSGESEENEISSYSENPSQDIISYSSSPVGIGADNRSANVLSKQNSLLKKPMIAV